VPAVLNAANEVAVARFLRHEIGFLDIPGTIRACMDAHRPMSDPSLADLEAADQEAREHAGSLPAGIGGC